MTSKLDMYIDKYLIPEILSQLDNEELISFKAESLDSLDSFMSCLYNIQLKTKKDKQEKERLLFVKFMRGDTDFRESSKSYTQYGNEIYTYNTVLPLYEKLLKDMKITSINVKHLVPPIYIAKFGYIEGLSSSTHDREAALVMENLKPLGYQLGPRLQLKRDHLLAMCQPLAQFHAFSYAVKALDPSQFVSLKKGIVDFPFINEDDPNDVHNNVYRYLHRHAFDRLFEFYDRKMNSNLFNTKSAKDLKLIKSLNKLREKYNEQPSRLQENLRTKVNDREEDRYFAAILHGDYNRNNVLFKYKSPTDKNAEQLVEAVKIIDFQQLRYGSPGLDLSFFMYFNTDANDRYEIWPELLKTYHNTMFSTLSTILNASSKTKQEISTILQHYSFEKFQSHFSRFAFYGVMICLHFLHWMLCSEQECARISELFATDIRGEEFRKMSLEVGGDEVNMRLLAVVRHACEMGYMDDL